RLPQWPGTGRALRDRAGILRSRPRRLAQRRRAAGLFAGVGRGAAAIRPRRRPGGAAGHVLLHGRQPRQLRRLPVLGLRTRRQRDRPPQRCLLVVSQQRGGLPGDQHRRPVDGSVLDLDPCAGAHPLEPHAAPAEMTRKRVAWLAAAAFLLFAVVLPTVALPGAKAEVLRALEQGLHRNITADALHLRLLPVPGVELDGVRLSDDAAFGLEDLVIADSATANLRWLALLRGRLAFSRISLDGANINLVRNAAGEWNVQALLQTTSRTSARAAGGHALPAAERFPYLVWSNSRVNFKLGVYRTRFYLDSVEGSLARESGAWRLQLRFQPERTDLNLSNTGDVRVDGRWSTASGEPWPFDLAIRLQDSYLAGSSALLACHDAGVHGILSAQLRVLGTAQRFEITGTASAQAVRRWDLLPPPASVRCAFRAAYSPGQDRLDLEDLGEAGWQRFRLQGTVASIFTAPRADLELALDQFRGADLLPLLEALKAHLPPDLRIGGAVSGSAHIALGGGQPLAGSGSLKLAAPTFTTATAMLGAPAAQVRWDGHRLRLLPVEAALK